MHKVKGLSHFPLMNVHALTRLMHLWVCYHIHFAPVTHSGNYVCSISNSIRLLLPPDILLGNI